MEKKFVPFEQAMKASKNGKEVRFYDKDGYYNTVFDFKYPINENGMEVHSFQELLEGRWLILDSEEEKTELELAFENDYTLIMSVDGESSIQSYYNINQGYNIEDIFVGGEISVPYSNYNAKIVAYSVCEETKTVLMSLTWKLKNKKQLAKEEFVKEIKKGKKLIVVDETKIKQNCGTYNDGDILEVRDYKELEEEERFEVWDAEKETYEYMYPNEWGAFEIYNEKTEE